MPVRVGINGFGRIGRQILKFDAKAAGIEWVAINDITDIKTLTHLLKYDSVHGRFKGDVQATDKGIKVNGQEIVIYAEKEPDKIPWKNHGVEIVIESTGKFVDRAGASKHMAQGVKKVLISAPAKEEDTTIAYGVNSDIYDPAKHHLISGASCTTNCLAPVAKVLHDTFGIVRGLMTTIHSYTNDQRLLDLPHKDLRRARAAAMAMIPTTTGAAKAVAKVLPALKGKLDGYALRVPTPNVSLVDLSVVLEKKPGSKDAINDAFKKAAEGPLQGILAVTDEPVVSIDFNGDTHSATVDLDSTMLIGDDLVKVLAWYDNETGYTKRLFDLLGLVVKKGL
ncbi:MAG: type I glyceraldehyde-3-phosphate dehydrogenase [Deltaproteobacteria bacterium]|nr:type I glyceraldehyde-3-phosphate dehydrogenase [Deltaproteobacteria bacterium]